ncbi:phosphate ABC transporter permease PstA [Pseudoroseicyclus aestuarii]|uniref:Phosphate transport system permease protein PstA n=1 Tax=Pseudoroseicyclus aestuarii TaxID=1795041 RepID=A0A318TCS8_9RHOB|nr:phosphate ABC transporter permease PstA [Pseudoroseicyclus aestuarii]PYE86108.1 phosphate ABC transporter membrane protein 2 (PhoT family) [Pseudoroseicyclus aestuarii]
MTDIPEGGAHPQQDGPRRGSLFAENPRIKARNRAEKRFRAYGIAAISIAMAFLCVLLFSIVKNGLPAFTQTYIQVDVTLDQEVLDPDATGDPAVIAQKTTFSYAPLIQAALVDRLAQSGIETEVTPDRLARILSSGAAAQLRNHVLANPEVVGETVEFDLLASSRVDGYMKGRVTREALARDPNLDAAHLEIIDALKAEGSVERRFNLDFITGTDASDSRPEEAGLGASVLGSFYMMLVVLLLALPIGVAASIYLEEFAPENRFTDLIEVNISNLAAVPSIVFGILGLAAFIQFAHLPASAPLVGGLVLTLMTLPTIIISTRASLRAVPPSIRDAALGVGASKMQATMHHVLPLAMPGILTGTILGLAQALGETAPLLLIGMVGFIASEYPDSFTSGFTDPNSAMPAQIYEWAKRADPAYYERAWGGIIVLLAFLLLMNIVAVLLRRRFERRW